MAYRDDEEDEVDDWDDEGEDSDGDSDEEPTISCPYCRREMLEDSPRCPHCERYISVEDSPAAGRPVWVVVTALVCLAIALWWVFATF